MDFHARWTVSVPDVYSCVWVVRFYAKSRFQRGTRPLQLFSRRLRRKALKMKPVSSVTSADAKPTITDCSIVLFLRNGESVEWQSLFNSRDNTSIWAFDSVRWFIPAARYIILINRALCTVTTDSSGQKIPPRLNQYNDSWGGCFFFSFVCFDRETRGGKKGKQWDGLCRQRGIGSDSILIQCRGSRLPLTARGAVLLHSCITGCHASCRRSVLHWCMRRVQSDSRRLDQNGVEWHGRTSPVSLLLPLMALTTHNSLDNVIFLFSLHY